MKSRLDIVTRRQYSVISRQITSGTGLCLYLCDDKSGGLDTKVGDVVVVGVVVAAAAAAAAAVATADVVTVEVCVGLVGGLTGDCKASSDFTDGEVG